MIIYIKKIADWSVKERKLHKPINEFRYFSVGVTFSIEMVFYNIFLKKEH
jgi:hypothetical protein